MPAPLPPEQIDVATFYFDGDSRIPNHPRWPLVVYRGALPDADATTTEALLRENGWGGTWRDGVFAYHHYHSTSHEVLAVVGGEARVTFGGERGETLTIRRGDVAVLPAGTGHCRVEATPDFLVVGAYPRGQEDYDVCTGEPDERPEALERIRHVTRPDADPLYGDAGPLLTSWST